jgi:hypothetical protein
LPGNFFLVEGQKKGSINHYYLSVRIKSARVRWRHWYRVTGLPSGIELIPLDRTGAGDG